MKKKDKLILESEEFKNYLGDCVTKFLKKKKINLHFISMSNSEGDSGNFYVDSRFLFCTELPPMLKQIDELYEKSKNKPKGKK